MTQRTTSHLSTRVGTQLVDKLLGTGLYSGIAAIIYELLRNAWDSCMPEKEWRPELVHVELSLVKDHHLAPGCVSLVCMDRGSGLTPEKEKRFRQLTPDEEDLVGQHGGSSQKQIGRASYVSASATKHFYMLTSATYDGPYRLLHVTSRSLIGDGIEVTSPYGRDDEVLGQYRNLRGTGSIVVIPNSRITSEDELREALRWRISRRQDCKMKIIVGGKLLEAPPLEKGAGAFGGIEWYLGHSKTHTHPDQKGVWLTDLKTGLRCARAPKISSLPDPLGHPDLRGDIMIPNLLVNQDTARDTLDANFLKTKAWRDARNILELKVAPYAQHLLGESNLILENSDQAKALDAIAELFAGCWGEPKEKGKPIRKNPPNRKPPVPGNETDKGEDGSDKGSEGNDPPGEGSGGVGKHRHAKAMRVDGQDFKFKPYSLDESMYAEPGADEITIFINPRYAVRLPSDVAQSQHHIDRILTAIAIIRQSDPLEAARLAARYRLDLQKSQTRKK